MNVIEDIINYFYGSDLLSISDIFKLYEKGFYPEYAYSRVDCHMDHKNRCYCSSIYFCILGYYSFFDYADRETWEAYLPGLDSKNFEENMDIDDSYEVIYGDMNHKNISDRKIISEK